MANRIFSIRFIIHSLSAVLLASSFSLNAQRENEKERYRMIPAGYLGHPELGVVFPAGLTNEVDYELIHLRDEYSRTFLNRSGSLTTAHSSVPLHYRDKSGFYLTLDYRLTSFDGTTFRIPDHKPEHKFNSHTNEITFYDEGARSMVSGRNRKVNLYDHNDEIIASYMPDYRRENAQIMERAVIVEELFPGIDAHHFFYEGLQKTNYILKNSSILSPLAEKLVVEEVVAVPAGWNFVYEYQDDTLTGRIVLRDNLSRDVLIFQHPVITDSEEVDIRTRYFMPQYYGEYSFHKVSDTLFLIKLSVDAAWLKHPGRVFPVIIDPTVVLNSTTVMNSCFSPNYQQGTLTLNVPAGQTIYNTYLEWDFVATSGSGAWKSDQRSYVSGPFGQTFVLSGTGDVHGLQTYILDNTFIANGISTGSVNITFHASRTWGGSGCNATFNYMNRRYVEITYDMIVFGPGQIVINEYSASNMTLMDGFGRSEDWIELLNTSANYVDLSGYYLSDNPLNPLKWQISSGFIPPGGRVLVFCSGRDISSGVVFHANFRLSQLKPEHVLFSDPNGVLLESYPLWTTQNGHSYGRVTDGAAQWGVFGTPTPYQANTGARYGYTSTPDFSLSAGHYSTGQTVTISTQNPNEFVRYTINGFDPTTNSSLYTHPLQVNQTTVVRARTFSNDTTLLPGFIETNSYLINENHTLPVFSFSGNQNLLQLFGGNQNLKPVGTFEFFDEHGLFIDRSTGDFDKHGNDSWGYPQRGVDFVSRDEYGYNDALRHKFFSTSHRTEFQRLMVKAAANDNYPFETGGAHIRDSYIQSLSQLSGLNLDERSSSNVIVYVNGQYWGVYDLREKVDDHDYTDFYYGQDRQHPGSDLYIQFLKTWGSTQAEYGNQPAVNDWAMLRQYVQANNMSNQVHFDFVDSLLDIESLIDYFVINSVMVSRDWLNYNTGWWRGLNPQGGARKWRYILWDQEAALGHYTNFTGLPNVTATADPCQVENLTVSNNGHVQILSKLINQNPDVRRRYVTRYADLLNTHFSCASMIHLLDSMVAGIAPEMPRQIQRWNAGSMTEWQDNVQAVRNFLQTRCSSLVVGLASCYNLTGPFTCSYDVYPPGTGKIRMNSEWLTSYPFQALMYGNIETMLKAEPVPGFEFSHWVADSVVINPNDSVQDVSLMFTQPANIVAHFINPNQTDDSLIYYWHFNDLFTPVDVKTIEADFKLIPTANPLMTYVGTGPRDMDLYSTGSILNLHQMQGPGTAARVRNPSTGRSLDFDLPTTSYAEIKFDYAVHRSGSGMLKNIISYSIDGINFIQTGLQTTEFDIDETYSQVSVDFTGIPGVDHNPDFKIRITFWGNTTQSNGNNRFDNISLRGKPTDISVREKETMDKLNVKVYPNPSRDIINIEVADCAREMPFRLIDLSGRAVTPGTINSELTTVDVSGCQPGMYFLQLQGRLFKIMVIR